MRTAGKRRLRHATLVALLGAIALAIVLPTTSAIAAEPWYQIETGARPTNLWAPADEDMVQEVDATKSGNGWVVAEIEVEGALVGCLGAGAFSPLPGIIPPTETASERCEKETSFPADETATELRETLEGPYGAGSVEVTGGPVGDEPLIITTPGRWVGALELSVLQGKASSAVTSQGSGRIVVTVTNVGDAPADGVSKPITVIDKLPSGVTAYRAEAFAGNQNINGPVNCSVAGGGSEVSCTLAHELPPFEAIEVEAFVSVDPSGTGASGEVTISGGGGASSGATQALHVSPEETNFGIQSFSMQTEEEGGGTTRQAGKHPFQLTTALQLNAAPVSGTATDRRVEQPALPRNFRFPLPAGLVGDPSSIETCSYKQFITKEALINECPDASAIGVASVTIIEDRVLGFTRLAVPIFNLEPLPGEPARFGFLVVGIPVTIDTALDAEDEYQISALSINAPETATLLATTATFWGNPGDPRHDSARGWNCAYFAHPGPCTRPKNLSGDAFLSMPVNCTNPLDFGMELEPWNVPLGSDVERASSTEPPLLGCSNVPFNPAVVATASERAESASGLDFNLRLPNANLQNPDGISETEPKKIEVTLPEGMTANPSAAEGQGVCSEDQYRAEKLDSKPGEGCPESSKLGTVSSHTPLVEGTVEGSLYLAKPFENPFHSLLAMYLVARLPERGVLVKQAGLVEPDPRTGRLRTVFDKLPQLPYSDVSLQLREGPRAPLVTPPGCGEYQVTAKFLPYSAANLENPEPGDFVERTSPLSVDHGPDGGGCPAGSPFDPGFEAGTINNDAASYSPFDMRLTRHDGDQDLTRFSAKLPPGLVAKLAGTTECSDAAIAQAKGRTGPHGGEEERSSPSCPASSQIGSVMTGAGVGSSLTWVPGKLYLAGPYKGAQLSVVSIVPAVAGPFDLGTVVIREALRVNPRTAEVEADGSSADPIPHILRGVPLRVRDIRIHVDKPDFTLNPTSCEPSATDATLWGGGTASAPRADSPVSRSARYQAANCASLRFKPKLKLKLKGATKRTGHPGLKAVVTYPKKGRYANIARAQVGLPHSEFLDQGNLNKVCKQADLQAATCPKSSIYGHAKAWTPLLDKPLQGPVYLGVGFGYKLPALVADLNGQIRILLVGKVDTTRHKGIRSTFEVVPDAPVSRFVLTMKGGKRYGLIENSENLCARTQRASALFNAQNGLRLHTRPKIGNSCKHRKRRKNQRAHARSSGRRQGAHRHPGRGR